MNKPSSLLIFLFIISIFSLESKEPSMLTVPLKVLHNSFEKFPISNETHLIYEKKEKVQTFLGEKSRTLIEEKHGIVKKLDCLLFAAEITIGRSQTFYVILDTGSANLWVAGINSNDTSEIQRHYDPSKSSTKAETSETFELEYGTGETKGVYYTDLISFITPETHDIKFGVASQTNFNADGADGIMGLARHYSDRQFSKIWMMAAKNIISSKSFSFKYISDDNVDMFLGDEHSDFKQENNTVQCKLLNGGTYQDLFWTCRLYQFGLYSKKDISRNATTNCGYPFLFDTGSNIMMLPLETLKQLTNDLSRFNCSKYKDPEDESYKIVCFDKENLPNFMIEVGDHFILLDSDEMYNILKDDNGNYEYIFNIAFQENFPIALIGQPFFKLFHTKFDYENKVLKFYSEDESKFIFTSIKPDEKEPISWTKIGIAVAVAFAGLLILCCICRCIRKMFCIK